MTPQPGARLHVVVVADSDTENDQTRHDLVIQLHWMLHNNPDVATCAVLCVARNGAPSVGPTSDACAQQFLMDRRLVSTATCGGALRATLEEIYQKGDFAGVVRVE